METGWVTLTEHPEKLRSVQMAAVIPSAGQQLVKIGQAEVSDSYIWVTERAGWQPFRPHESAAATRKQQLKWKFLEEAERSVMWLQVSASHRRYPFPYSCCSINKSSILGRLSGVEIDFYGRGGNNIADAKGCAWLKERKKRIQLNDFQKDWDDQNRQSFAALHLHQIISQELKKLSVSDQLQQEHLLPQTEGRHGSLSNWCWTPF